jgi:hypothetical protein
MMACALLWTKYFIKTCQSITGPKKHGKIIASNLFVTKTARAISMLFDDSFASIILKNS